MSKCPLCKGVKLQKIFEAKNAFVSVGDLATQNYDALNGGGGYIIRTPIVRAI